VLLGLWSNDLVTMFCIEKLVSGWLSSADQASSNIWTFIHNLI